MISERYLANPKAIYFEFQRAMRRVSAARANLRRVGVGPLAPRSLPADDEGAHAKFCSSRPAQIPLLQFPEICSKFDAPPSGAILLPGERQVSLGRETICKFDQRDE